jgi:hypothetical protein
MTRLIKKRWAAGTALGVAVVVAGAGEVPAFADAPDDTLAVVAAATPETVANAASVPTVSSGENAIDAKVAGLDVTVPVNAADGITVTSDGGTVSIALPFADQAEDAQVQKAGVVSYDNGNSSTTVPVVQKDGSVQINTVIESAAAPTRYAYPVDLPAGASVQEVGGSLLFMDAEGALLGGLAPAWAKDATGADVPTRYEVNGTTVTQVVEHTTKHAHPVTADPWLGTNLFGSMERGTYAGKPKYRGALSTWGIAVYSGAAQGGGLLGSSAGRSIMYDAGWTEWKSRLVGSNPAATLKQQYDCHVYGGYAFWAAGTHWDLESFRYSNPSWANNVFGHRCNWE